MIKDIECPEFKFPENPKQWVVTNEDGTSTQEKINKRDIHMWKKNYELVHMTKV